MPRRRELCRKRTSSQSSVEIQVTKEEAILTSSLSASHAQSTGQQITQLQPSQDFLNLLRDVGAFGRKTSGGELFTLNNLTLFLIEYIKKKQLYDPVDPRIIHCDNDPLGNVFGVSCFTKEDTMDLLLQNTFPINHRKRKHGGCESPKVIDTFLEQGEAPEEGTIVSSTNASASEGKCSSENRKVKAATLRSISPSGNKLVDEINIVFGRRSPHVEASTAKERHSPVDRKSVDNETSRLKRARQSSFTIVYDRRDNEGSNPWSFQVELPESGSESEPCSVQSKTTEVVRSCEENDDWSRDEQISVHDSYTIEIQQIGSTDPPFDEEFEIASDSGSSVSHVDIDGGSSSGEEFFIVCRDSDKEFWADIESSDDDDNSDMSSEFDISEQEKWTCDRCGVRNTPVRSRCDKCYTIRPGWLEGPERRFPSRGRARGRRPPRKTSSLPASPRPSSSNDLTSHSDRELMPPISSSQETTPFDCDSLKVVSSQSDTMGMSMVRISEGDDSSDGITVEAPADSTSPAVTTITGSAEEQRSVGPGAQVRVTGNSDVVVSSQEEDDVTHDSGGSTEIIQESDEEQLSQELFSFEQQQSLRRLHCQDSGISDDFFSSQGSVMGESSSHNTAGTEKSYAYSALESSESVATVVKLASRKRSLGNKSRSVPQAGSSGSPSRKMTKHDSLPPKTTESNLCTICYSQPINAMLVHGKSGHWICCYACGKTVKQRDKCCPVCRRKIDSVIKSFK